MYLYRISFTFLRSIRSLNIVGTQAQYFGGTEPVLTTQNEDLVIVVKRDNLTDNISSLSLKYFIFCWPESESCGHVGNPLTQKFEGTPPATAARTHLKALCLHHNIKSRQNMVAAHLKTSQCWHKHLYLLSPRPKNAELK